MRDPLLHEVDGQPIAVRHRATAVDPHPIGLERIDRILRAADNLEGEASPRRQTIGRFGARSKKQREARAAARACRRHRACGGLATTRLFRVCHRRLRPPNDQVARNGGRAKLPPLAHTLALYDAARLIVGRGGFAHLALLDEKRSCALVRSAPASIPWLASHAAYDAVCDLFGIAFMIEFEEPIEDFDSS